jgi:hypothetical protein
MRVSLASSINGCKRGEQRLNSNACIRANTAGREESAAAGYGLAKQPEVSDQSGHSSMMTKRKRKENPIVSSLKLERKKVTRSDIS